MDCSQIQTSLKHIIDLRTQFTEVYSRVDENKGHHDPENIQAIESSESFMKEIQLVVKNLEKLLIPEIISILELQQQYEAQKQILMQAGLLERLSTGELGITGIDRQEYSLPTFDQIIKRIRAKEEILKIKSEQGFKKLILVPLGMPLSSLIKSCKQPLLRHYGEGKLQATDGTIFDSDKYFNVDQPVYVWDGFINRDAQGIITYEADKTGDLIYFPTAFDQANHQGKTKTELLKKMQDNPAWQVLLLEDLPDLPAENQGQTIGGRKQLEANQTPNNYLNTIQTKKQYQNEQGLTLESWLIYALTQLQEKNQIIDDYQGQGKACYLTGSYQKKFGVVPNAVWDRNSQQAYLSRRVPSNRVGNDGCRSGVMI